jgi:hypothetical protein
MKKTTDQPLTKLADAAFEQAAQQVIERARQSDTPLILWEDDAVKEVVPEHGRANRDSQKPLLNGET